MRARSAPRKNPRQTISHAAVSPGLALLILSFCKPAALWKIPEREWRKFEPLTAWTDKNIPIVKLKHAFE